MRAARGFSFTFAFPLALTLALSACSLFPDYKRPEIKAPEAFRRGLSAVVANPGLILAPLAFGAAATAQIPTCSQTTMTIAT